MYATIRRYTPKGTVNQNAINDYKGRVENSFVPALQDIRGFHCYYLLIPSKNEILAIGLFDDKTGATESTRRAAEWVKKDPLKDQLGSPEIFEGEVLVSKEAMVGAR